MRRPSRLARRLQDRPWPFEPPLPHPSAVQPSCTRLSLLRPSAAEVHGGPRHRRTARLAPDTIGAARRHRFARPRPPPPGSAPTVGGPWRRQGLAQPRLRPHKMLLRVPQRQLLAPPLLPSATAWPCAVPAAAPRGRSRRVRRSTTAVFIRPPPGPHLIPAALRGTRPTKRSSRSWSRPQKAPVRWFLRQREHRQCLCAHCTT